ncbi:DUF3422 family protein [Paracoccus tegillarcae]|uniref:DUF3422 domain-containing protein n=1 Tax=Paracoccus tegillarcae TaxID=1529068 RepID=A0A2K9EV52_9RHOB|nr:DUF3422 domain-containing protein [Paracoccus tegillarcae]AUH34766.1 DUF3422 domain-containing protein [Paracoccus tegillarcae]
MTPQDDHPLRYGLVNELHARPSPRLSAPATVVYTAFKETDRASTRDRRRDDEHLSSLAARYGAPRPDPEANHYAGPLGRHKLRWERHTEFVTYTAYTPGLPPRAFDPSAGAIFPEEWQAAAPGKRIAAVIIQILPLPEDTDEAREVMEKWFVTDGLAAAWVLEEAALVAGDFRIDAAGWMRFAIFVRPGEGEGRVGRIVQRILELETYRAMSMMGLPRARALSSRLNALDPQLSAIVEGMADDSRPADDVLQELLAVSARLEAEATQSHFRFGATKAYEAIVMDRVAVLRESRWQGRQTLTEFMTRRYEPAMRTVISTEARLKTMLERTDRAAELLRTRADVQRSAQNQALLESMDRRAALQLRLQHTVEGLSVVAISYYALGLLSYALAPVASAAGMDKAVLLALLTPLAILLVWGGLRRIRAGLEKPPGEDGH